MAAQTSWTRSRIDQLDIAITVMLSRLGVALISVVAALQVGASNFPGVGVASVGIPLVIGCWGYGRVAHSRGPLAARLRLPDGELPSIRDERARLAVASDRAQLSGELDTLLRRRLHDLAELADRGPGSVADGSAVALLMVIERESRATLDQMRALVGVLRLDEQDVVIP